MFHTLLVVKSIIAAFQLKKKKCLFYTKVKIIKYSKNRKVTDLTRFHWAQWRHTKYFFPCILIADFNGFFFFPSHFRSILELTLIKKCGLIGNIHRKTWNAITYSISHRLKYIVLDKKKKEKKLNKHRVLTAGSKWLLSWSIRFL